MFPSHHTTRRVSGARGRGTMPGLLRTTLAGLAVTGIAGGLSLTALSPAHADPTFSYVDAHGVPQTPEPATVLTGTETELNSDNGAWYLCDSTLAYRSDTAAGLVVHGDVNLVLGDQCSMTVTEPGDANAYHAGIQVQAGDSLTIWAQTTAGNGLLDVTGGRETAGIGSNEDATAGTITINGGTVYARGGDGAGIGGGYRGNGGDIAIHGGTVKAGSTAYGAGIGGGGNASNGTVTIDGGRVTAFSNLYGAGIGGGGGYGQAASGGTVVIGGTAVVRAFGGPAGNYGSGAGIGSGGAMDFGTAGTVSVNQSAQDAAFVIAKAGASVVESMQGADVGHGGSTDAPGASILPTSTATLTRTGTGVITGPEVDPTTGKIEHIAEGSTLPLIVAPSSDLLSLSDNDDSVIGAVANGRYTISRFSGAHTINATFPAQVKQSQQITFTAPTTAVIGESFTTAASSSSGLRVAITIDDATTNNACMYANQPQTIGTVGRTISFTQNGTCVLNADQAGDDTYSAAQRVQRTITVGSGHTTTPPVVTDPTPPVDTTPVPPVTVPTQPAPVGSSVSTPAPTTAGHDSNVTVTGARPGTVITVSRDRTVKVKHATTTVGASGKATVKLPHLKATTNKTVVVHYTDRHGVTRAKTLDTVKVAATHLATIKGAEPGTRVTVTRHWVSTTVKTVTVDADGAPATVSLPTRGLGRGQHHFVVRYTDQAGAAESTTVTVKIKGNRKHHTK